MLDETVFRDCWNLRISACARQGIRILGGMTSSGDRSTFAKLLKGVNIFETFLVLQNEDWTCVMVN